ncbi:hypothetical protein [Oryzifoliimicrobium ureilyticus]|uniref:hypothetical protein n=1 Tax=Oryzifoliimicrobium ureilyticus TaxID=3113724 RepID=UPI0030762C50
MQQTNSAAPAALALNIANQVVHKLCVKGVLSTKEAHGLLTEIAATTRADDIGGGVFADWLDEAAKQYLAVELQ